MKKSVSIIIPAYNSAKTLRYTLESIVNLKGDYVKETLIVDSSDDGNMPELMTAFKKHKNIKLIDAGTRVMPAIGRNIGAKKATGKLLVFFDADVIVNDDYLEHIVAAYNEGILAGGGSIIVPSSQKWHPVAVSQYYLQLNEYLPSGNKRPKEFFPGCNIFCDKKLFNKVGGFPEVRAAEDVLLGKAINKHTQQWFIPKATVAHLFRLDWLGIGKNQRMLGKYIAIYRKGEKHSIIYKGIFPLLLFPIFFTYKHALTIPRIFKSGIKNICKFLLITPLYSWGILFWTIGFTQGSLSNEDK